MPLAILHSAGAWAERFGNSGKRTALTIGNFDGVHLGHQKILQGVRERARQSGPMSAVLTFYPHPARVLRPAEAPALLETLAQRLGAIEAMGIEAALVIQFDAELAKLSPEDFVRRFLVDTMRAQSVLIGTNFRFGHHQAGDAKSLADLGAQWGFEVAIVPPVVEEGSVVSSTAVRQALRGGNVEQAARMLGRPFSLAGEIRTGTGQGRKLVVPTLNLATEQELLPKDGVYATEAMVEGKTYRAATNVGVRPTFDGARRTVESHLLDFSEDLTSGKLEVRFLKRLRDEQKFSGATELRAQVLRDIEEAKEYFREAASKTA
ncbi:MAG TPA: bifunctional riboflavin kinase/FAD synthetase [Candidatus Acidoferrales bacterium]